MKIRVSVESDATLFASLVSNQSHKIAKMEVVGSDKMSPPNLPELFPTSETIQIKNPPKAILSKGMNINLLSLGFSFGLTDDEHGAGYFIGPECSSLGSDGITAVKPLGGHHAL
jgi:hypothetical protein